MINISDRLFLLACIFSAPYMDKVTAGTIVPVLFAFGIVAAFLEFRK